MEAFEFMVSKDTNTRLMEFSAGTRPYVLGKTLGGATFLVVHGSPDGEVVVNGWGATPAVLLRHLLGTRTLPAPLAIICCYGARQEAVGMMDGHDVTILTGEADREVTLDLCSFPLLDPVDGQEAYIVTVR